MGLGVRLVRRDGGLMMPARAYFATNLHIRTDLASE